MKDITHYRKGFGPADGPSAIMSDGELIAMQVDEITALRKRVEVLGGAGKALACTLRGVLETIGCEGFEPEALQYWDSLQDKSNG